MKAFGVCYYPEQWPRSRWATDARRMREAGFDTVRLGEFAWALLEPSRELFDFDWLEEALATLSAEGLKVVLGTPTAAPPAWLTHAEPEVLNVGPDGRRRVPGSRRHACVGNARYRAHCERIVTALADRFGEHPAVVGWQIDNELGCHDTARCHCLGCSGGFRAWLKGRHGSLNTLNDAWGSVCWSQRYSDWAEIQPPVGLTYDANPGHWLDWCRYSASTHEAFLTSQAALVRRRSPGRFVTTNLMGHFDALDASRLAAPLDVVGFDNYAPPGWTPEQAGFDLDRMRGLKQQGFWVLEQPAGAINWGETNAALRPGEVRLRTYQAIAHGADGVLYFRWRAGCVGAEQLHGGVLPHDGVPGRTFWELQALAGELAHLPTLETRRAPVALLRGEPNRWALAKEPHHQALKEPDAYDLPYYTACVRHGLAVDVLPPEAAWQQHPLVVAASQYLLDAALLERLTDYVKGGGHLVLGVRSGFKDGHNRVAAEGLVALTGVRVAEFEAPGAERLQAVTFEDTGERTGVDRFVEWLEPVADTEVVARYTQDFQAGAAAVTRRRVGAGTVWYVGTLGADEALFTAVVTRAAQAAGLDPQPLPPGIEVTDRATARGQLRFVLNHTAEARTLEWPHGGRHSLTGSPVGMSLSLPPYGVALVAMGGA